MNRILLFGIVLIAIFVISCSSGASTASNAEVAAANSAPPANSPLSANPANADSQTGTLAEVPAGSEVTAPAANGIEFKRKLNVDANPNAPIPEGPRVPASENSEMSTTMDKAGNFVETRYFKADPMLVKVKRTWLGPGKSTMIITLKNGKVVTAAGDSIPNLAIAPIPTLLALAGIKQAAPADTGAR